MKKFAAILLLLSAIVSCSPKTSLDYCRMGFKQINKNTEKSNLNFRKAIELDSLNQYAYYGLGIITIHSKDSDMNAAIRYFRKATLIDSTYSLSWAWLGEIYLRQSFNPISDTLNVDNYKLREAIWYFEKAIQTDSTDGISYYNIGYAYSYLGDTLRRNTYFEKACSLGVCTSLHKKIRNFSPGQRK